jgi:mono/diheme cytochrome c family protein
MRRLKRDSMLGALIAKILQSGSPKTRHPGGSNVQAVMNAGMLLVAACFGALGPASAQELFNPTRDPVAGARLFEAKGCVQCHAINGEGGKDGPDLGRLQGARSFYEVAAAMWNHLPQMARRFRASGADRPYLTPNQMSDLIAFLYGPRSLDESGPGVSGDPRRGEQLIAAKGCLDCHSLAPPRGKTAGSLTSLKGVDSPWTVMATMWNHSFLMAVMTRDQNTPWPSLSSAEMADLVAFLRAHAYGNRGR